MRTVAQSRMHPSILCEQYSEIRSIIDTPCKSGPDWLSWGPGERLSVIALESHLLCEVIPVASKRSSVYSRGPGFLSRSMLPILKLPEQ